MLGLDEADEVIVDFARAGLHLVLSPCDGFGRTRSRVRKLREARDLVRAEWRGAGVVTPVGEDDTGVVVACERQELLEISCARVFC